MFISTVSNSKLNSFQQCRLKYRYRYVDRLGGLTPLNQNALNFGSYIHKIFEDGVEATTREELNNIAEELKKTYSIKSEEDRTRKCIDNFLRFNASLSETVSTEQRFEVELKEDITLNGIIDRVIKGKEGGFLVVDYKTSKREKSKIDLFQDDQLKGYVFAVHKMYNVPLGKITAAHYYPLTDNFVSVKYSPNQIGAHLKKVVDEVWTIRKCKKTDLTPSRNEFCDWCEYKTLCPVFEDAALIEESIKKLKTKD
jgi:RecB family exonuclease